MNKEYINWIPVYIKETKIINMPYNQDCCVVVAKLYDQSPSSNLVNGWITNKTVEVWNSFQNDKIVTCIHICLSNLENFQTKVNVALDTIYNLKDVTWTDSHQCCCQGDIKINEKEIVEMLKTIALSVSQQYIFLLNHSH